MPKEHGMRENSESDKTTHNSRPDTRYGHVLLDPGARKVHGQPLGQDAHAHLAHGIRRLAPEEARVDGGADDDETAAAPRAQMRQARLDDGV